MLRGMLLKRCWQRARYSTSCASSGGVNIWCCDSPAMKCAVDIQVRQGMVPRLPFVRTVYQTLNWPEICSARRSTQRKKPFPFSIPPAPPWSQDVTFPHVDVTSKNFKTSTGSSSTNVSTSDPSPSPICPSILAPPYLTELLHWNTPLPLRPVCPGGTGSTPLPLPFPLSSLPNSPSEHTSAHNLWWTLLSSSLSHTFMDYCSVVLSRKKRKAWLKSNVKLL